MSSIRKLKRRAMARMNCPRVEVRLPEMHWQFFAGMTSIERENTLRVALRQYVEHYARQKAKEAA